MRRRGLDDIFMSSAKRCRGFVLWL